MRSFLNLLDIESGREIRLAEFGFYAEKPSFCGELITFERDGKLLAFSPEDGKLSPFKGEVVPTPHKLMLNFTSPFSGKIAYAELIFGRRVLVRFMASNGSLGAAPISPDGTKLVFFGYPAEEFGPAEEFEPAE